MAPHDSRRHPVQRGPHRTSGGGFRFGEFSIADAMFAPVALRFRTYGVELDTACQACCDHMIGLPAIQRWLADARIEPAVVAAVEPHAPPTLIQNIT